MASTAPTLATTPTPDDPRLGAWRAFIQANSRLMRRLDEDLQAAHGLSLAEYDALLQLVNAPDRRLRMSVLAERVLLSRSGMTRLVDRLEAAGMVVRSACVTDARGAEAALTDGGLERLRAASHTHLDGVQRYFLEPIGDTDLVAVERAGARIIDGLGRDGAADAAACAVPADA